MNLKKMIFQIQNEKFISFSEIAKQIGITETTLAHFLNGGNIRELTREKIEAFIEKYLDEQEENV